MVSDFLDALKMYEDKYVNVQCSLKLVKCAWSLKRKNEKTPEIPG